MIENNHPIENEELMAYLDDELSPDRAAAAVAHIERCKDCQKLAADLRGVSQQLMAWQVGSADPESMKGVTAALDKRGEKPGCATRVSSRVWRDIPSMRRVSPWTILGFAGAALALLLTIRLIGTNEDRVFSQVANAIEGDDTNSGAPGKMQARAQQGSAGKVGDLVDGNVPIANGPIIVRKAALTLMTTEFDKVRADLEEILKRHSGYVGQLSIGVDASGLRAGRTLNADLRVPADQLEATMVDLRKLGRVESESQSAEDVTAQYVDLNARLLNARNTEQRLTDLLRQRTGKLADVLAVETEITRVRGEIERMEAERKNLVNRVGFATVTTTVVEDYKAQLQMVPHSASGRIRNSAVEGYRTMVEGVVGLVLFLLSYGPSLLLWGGLLFFPIRGVLRGLGRNPAQ
jgi:hypothetical protein